MKKLKFLKPALFASKTKNQCFLIFFIWMLTLLTFISLFFSFQNTYFSNSSTQNLVMHDISSPPLYHNTTHLIYHAQILTMRVHASFVCVQQRIMVHIGVFSLWSNRREENVLVLPPVRLNKK